MNKNYNFFSSLLGASDDSFKKLNLNETNSIFKKNFTKLGKWDERRNGIITENGRWSWMNRINTHPNCIKSFYEWCIEYDKNFFIDFGNPLYHEFNVKKMWNYLESNFELFFTKNKTEKFYSELENKCMKSWNNGIISLVSILFSLKNSFNGISNIDYTFEEGNHNDMKKGVDISFTLKDGFNKKIQVKSGKVIDSYNEMIISGSSNKLNYSVDYYAYSTEYYNGQTDIVIFENNKKNIIKNNDDSIKVKKESVIYFKKKFMSESNKLQKIFDMCLKEKFSFEFVKDVELENHINIDTENKKVEVNISDIDDENFNSLLDEKFLELDQFFKDRLSKTL